MNDKYLIVSLDENKSKKLGEAISNPTSIKIVNSLVEEERSASEIAGLLKIPLNTVQYNLNNLVDAGLIERVGGILWSVKGKKIEKYKVANKMIVISPKRSVASKIGKILPVAFLGTAVTGAIAWAFRQSATGGMGTIETRDSLLAAAPAAAEMAQKIVEEPAILSYSSPWIWFGLGFVTLLVVFAAIQWKKL